jgi:hypothetical protein
MLASWPFRDCQSLQLAPKQDRPYKVECLHNPIEFCGAEQLAIDFSVNDDRSSHEASFLEPGGIRQAGSVGIIIVLVLLFIRQSKDVLDSIQLVKQILILLPKIVDLVQQVRSMAN